MWWVPRRYCDALECVTSWQLFPRTTPAAREFRLLSFYSFLSSSSCCFVIIIIFFHFVIFSVLSSLFFDCFVLVWPFFSLTLFLTFLCLSFFTNINTMNYYRVFLLKYTTIYLTLPTLTAIKITLYDIRYNKQHLNLTRKTTKHRKKTYHMSKSTSSEGICAVLMSSWSWNGTSRPRQAMSAGEPPSTVRNNCYWSLRRAVSRVQTVQSARGQGEGEGNLRCFWKREEGKWGRAVIRIG